jgi:L-phenylalanine/L-methionine N-acetyltransferase
MPDRHMAATLPVHVSSRLAVRRGHSWQRQVLMTGVEIRHVRDDDAAAVQQILEAPHVVRGTMRLPFHAEEFIRERIRYVEGVTKLVAVREGSVAGYAELVSHPGLARHRHAGEINMIATHPNHRGKAIGEALMSAMVELADKWLQLSRLSLTVWTNNERAISMYGRFSFAIEGTMPRYVFFEGAFCDAHIMGRLNG